MRLEKNRFGDGHLIVEITSFRMQAYIRELNFILVVEPSVVGRVIIGISLKRTHGMGYKRTIPHFNRFICQKNHSTST